MLICLLAIALAAPPGDIAYLARANADDSQIHVINLESGAVRAVGLKGALDGPRWSPDGSTLAYTVQTPDGSAIYVVDADGAGGRMLEHAAPDARGPVWSPDGARIAYTLGHGLDAQIAVFDLASDTETVWAGGGTSLANPIWISRRLAEILLDPDLRASPFFEAGFGFDRNTRSLLLAVGWSGTPAQTSTDLFVVSENTFTPVADGRMPSSGAYAELRPAASETALAFDSNDGGDREVFVISTRRTFDLSNHRAADWNPVWSPVAETLLIESVRGGRSGIYHCVARRAGKIRTIAAFSDGDCWAPAWSADGTWIAYVSDRERDPAVYVVREDGEDHARISPAGIVADLPQWRPVP